MKTQDEIKAKLDELEQQEKDCHYCKHKLSHPASNPHWPRQGQIKILQWVIAKNEPDS